MRCVAKLRTRRFESGAIGHAGAGPAHEPCVRTCVTFVILPRTISTRLTCVYNRKRNATTNSPGRRSPEKQRDKTEGTTRSREAAPAAPATMETRAAITESSRVHVCAHGRMARFRWSQFTPSTPSSLAFMLTHHTTGHSMLGDLVLLHPSYPVCGGTRGCQRRFAKKALTISRACSG